MFYRLLPCLLAVCHVFLGVVHSQANQSCEAEADILLIMDSSGSIGATNYQTMLRFVANLTHSFTLGPDAIQFGAIIFGNTATNLFNFGTYTDHQSLESVILSTRYLQENTYTDAALRFARIQSFTGAYGARPGIAHIAIVLTDGVSNYPGDTAREAQLLQGTGALVLSIGIGVNINQTELSIIASSPLDVFQVDNFDVLETISKQVTNKTCQEVVNPPKQVLACEGEADILFLIGASPNTSRADYDKTIRFVANITRSYNVGPNSIQFAAIVYGDTPSLYFDFSSHTDNLALEETLLKASYVAGSTHVDSALNLARQVAFSPAHGARLRVPWITIALSDSLFADPQQAATQAQLLRNSGVKIFPVGIGTDFSQSQLETIASSPNDVITTNNFDVLDLLLHDVTENTCLVVNATRNDNELCNVTQKADILFILDSSGSIGIDNYTMMLNFVVNLTKNFNIGPSGIQFATIIYGDDAHEVFDFNTFSTHEELEKGITNITYIQGWTFTDKALLMAREQLFTAAKGSRPGVPKITIVFTDGQSNDKDETAKQADLLKSSGVLVMSIGIGFDVDQQELLNIASLPEDVFQVTNFNVLSTIQKQVTNRTCTQVVTHNTLCDAEADILLIIDSSSSILAANYNKMLNFVVTLTQSFNLAASGVQFASIIFSDNAVENFDFTKYANHSELEKGILNTPYINGNTYTDKALQLAREEMFTASKGSRPNATRIAIILTDGQSTNPPATMTQARLLKNSGVLVLSVGIGDSINKQELETIASLPQDVFQVTNFDLLDTVQKELTNKTCERVTEEVPKCPAVADILFIIDSTGSIAHDNYVTMLTFIANFTRDFAIGSNWVKFSSVIFGDNAHNEFGFNTYTTHAKLEEAILNSTYFGETTQTDLALKMAREVSFTPQNGARSGVEKVAIVLTDGRSNDPDLTAQQAKLLKDSGVLVIAVAIGVDILNRELETIATLPEDIFHVEHFEVLESIQREFSRQTCDRVAQKIECEAQADILFILDSSASIIATNYVKMLKFVANLTRNFDLGPNAVQFSTIIFGDDAHLVFDFGQYNNHPSIEQGILGITYLAQNTFTNRALSLARLEAFSSAHGARGNVSKIAIVLTDGQSSLPTETSRQAQLLKSSGVLILSVGIGDTVRLSELESIASLPENVFQVDNFGVLSTIQKTLTNKTCETVTGSQASACSKLTDIIFLLDSSGSISSDNYHQELLFAANFTENFELGPTKAQFGAVIFSDTATTLFDLNDFNDHWSILQTLLEAPHLKGGTNTAQALDKIFKDGLFNAPGGGRANATKMLIIMTDGQSANISTSVTAANTLKNMGVHIITIGMGDVVNSEELNSMASGPGDVFQASSYEVLHALQNDVANHTCNITRPPISAIHRACSEMADIIFVMDSSSSISPEEYHKQLLFASNLTQEFDVSPVDARFAAVVFSNDVFKVFDLEELSTHFDIYHGLLNSPHLTGTADIGKVFNWVNDLQMFSDVYGGRANASKIIVLISDSPSTDQAGAIYAADRLKKDGVHITAIGVNDYDLYELRQLASNPSSVFKATSIDSLHWIQTDMVDNICDFASTSP
jgi:collagen type VI alpha